MNCVRGKRRWLRLAALGLAIAVVGGCGPGGPLTSGRSPVSSPETVGFVTTALHAPGSDSFAAGLAKGASQLGGSVFFEGPASPLPYDQAQYAQELTGRHLSAVGVAATDPTDLCPTATIARRAGVLFFAAGADAACPDTGLFVEPAPPATIGADAVDILAAQIHGQGDVAVVSAAPTEADLQAWIAAMRSRMARYPNLHLLPVQSGALNSTQTAVIAERLMAAYPNLKGIIGASPTNVEPIARAVDQAGKKGQMAVTGIADPDTVRPSIDDGTINAVVSDEGTQLGYLTYWAVTQLLHHRILAATDTVPGLPAPVTWTAADRTLVLGPPVIVTKANIDHVHS